MRWTCMIAAVALVGCGDEGPGRPGELGYTPDCSGAWTFDYSGARSGTESGDCVRVIPTLGGEKTDVAMLSIGGTALVFGLDTVDAFEIATLTLPDLGEETACTLVRNIGGAGGIPTGFSELRYVGQGADIESVRFDIDMSCCADGASDCFGLNVVGTATVSSAGPS